MSTQIPFNADGIKIPTSIVAETFNFTDGEAVSLRPELRKVDGNLVATTNIVMSSAAGGFVSTTENGGDYDIWFNAATGDADGNLYAVGDDDDNGRAMVYAFAPTGGLKWKVMLDQIDNYSPESYAIDFADDRVNIGFRYYDGNSDQVGILKLNAADGTVIESTLLTSPQNANPRINAMATKSDGDQIIVGGIYGEFNTITNLTAQPPSGPGVLWINNSDLPVPSDGGNWEVDVNGTWWGLNQKNTVPSAPTETITGIGTGMTLYIQWSTENNSYGYMSINAPGNDYNVPDRIRVRGNILGGIDNTDITATATSSSDVDGNTVAVYDKATYPTMSSIQAGWHIIFPSGLAYEVVSVTDAGATWEVAVVSNGVDFSGPGMYTGGGDDLFMYIADSYGYRYPAFLFSATPVGKARFEISDQNDFSANGPYSVRYSLDSQAYIWTPNWQHTYGDVNWQTFKDVAVSNLDEIYLLGDFNKEIDGNWYSSLLMKLDSSGQLQWAKYVADSTAAQGNAGSVCVDTDGNVFVVGENDDGYTNVTKLDSSGTVVWQIRQTNGSDWDNEPRAAIDADGNIYVSGVWYNGDYDVVSIMKISGSDGSLIWARQLGNTEQYSMREFYDDDSQPMKVVGNGIYYCGYCYDVNDDQYVGVAVRLLTDGTTTGTFGRWVYTEDSDAQFETSTSDAVVIDSGYTNPTDGVSQSVSGNSVYVSTRSLGGEFETNESLGGAAGSLYNINSIRWGDGTTQTTFHEKHGNYNFNENNFNMPSDAELNSSGQVNMNFGDLGVTTSRLDYSISYGVNYNVNNFYNVNAYSIQLTSENSTTTSQNISKVIGYNGVTIGSSNLDQYNWSFLNMVLSYPASMSSRMEIQGAVTTVMGDTIAANGHSSAISSGPFYTASSAGISAVKIMARITMENNEFLQTFLLEYMFVRDYSGGTGLANRVNDVVTASRVGHASTTVETTESYLVGSINAQGRLQVRVNMMTGGNSGTLTYTAQEFEVPDGYMGGMY